MVDILAFGAHPDDLEFDCGGILAMEAARGRSIVMIDLTLGDKGSHGSPEIRRKEGMAAAQLIGAERVFLDFKDCELMDNYESRLELVKMIRKFQPKLVIAPMWKGEQNHPDHTACGSLARAACRFARFKNILPNIPPHHSLGILHYPHTAFCASSDFIMDVTPALETWKGMMNAHASQHETLPYFEMKLKAAAYLGTLIGVPFAQGLIKGNPLEVKSVMEIAKGAREF